ncbi:MAG: Glycosyl transferase family 39 [candidate division WWE3 bacterium GW2011_GWE1_41_27]|uniref:Glycosyl transferase family 39 n=1 Tax=candidate division WWE3 bacterium GW2011_GWE1_41_27 TaxID=1619131 RepID=A0A0G0Z1D0_UNCKA|nr:MAG: Glycosyl transferase family 39 [candidate division WWE3 bacterium GW2011_GWE1_41_27]
MKKLIEKINLVLFGVMVPAVILRLFNLGYSDYQGDEIKALFLPGDGQNFFSYLLDQRKGPVQFLITFLLKFINPDYTNQLLIRLPFALAGILSVFFLYKLVEMHFGKRTALLSALLLGSNGFFVAFSRIVQYQSFTILFMVLALYMLTLSVKRSEYKHKGMISHYDAVFILPFVMYLMSVWLKRNFKKDPRALKTLIISLTVSAALLLAFYIPFVLSISESTLSYWSGRISGDVSAKISSSKYLFSVYQPIYVVHFYVLASLLGLAFLYYKAYGVKLPKKIAFKSAASLVFYTFRLYGVAGLHPGNPHICVYFAGNNYHGHRFGRHGRLPDRKTSRNGFRLGIPSHIIFNLYVYFCPELRRFC